MIHLAPRSVFAVATAAVLVTLCAGTPAAKPSPSKAALVEIPGSISVKAAPEAVWEAVTRDRGIMTLGGYTPTSMAPSRRFEKAGDTVPAAASGDAGLLVVTRLDADAHELRVFFEPQSGKYLCHTTVTVQGLSGTTRVSVLHRYSDEKAATAEKTARDVAAAVPGQLAAFKAMVEGR